MNTKAIKLIRKYCKENQLGPDMMESLKKQYKLLSWPERSEFKATMRADRELPTNK